jgi:uncharacterized protein (DUF1330 family)
MPVYVIAQIEVEDADAYAAYQNAGLPTVVAAGGRIVAGGPGGVSLEGQALPNGTAIVEFPSMDAALTWYHSEDYQQTIPLRTQCSKAQMIAVVPGLAAS